MDEAPGRAEGGSPSAAAAEPPAPEPSQPPAAGRPKRAAATPAARPARAAARRAPAPSGEPLAAAPREATPSAPVLVRARRGSRRPGPSWTHPRPDRAQCSRCVRCWRVHVAAAAHLRAPFETPRGALTRPEPRAAGPPGGRRGGGEPASHARAARALGRARALLVHRGGRAGRPAHAQPRRRRRRAGRGVQRPRSRHPRCLLPRPAPVLDPGEARRTGRRLPRQMSGACTRSRCCSLRSGCCRATDAYRRLWLQGSAAQRRWGLACTFTVPPGPDAAGARRRRWSRACRTAWWASPRPRAAGPRAPPHRPARRPAGCGRARRTPP
jgi:hypothetical protein